MTSSDQPASGAVHGDADATAETLAMRTVPTLVKPPTTAETVAAAIDRWRSTLVSLAGGSTLADVGLLGDAVLDLTAAHPSGIAQLFAGRSTRLANIFREGSSLVGTERV